MTTTTTSTAHNPPPATTTTTTTASVTAVSQQQEFRNYLATSGVLDALTKVLVGLYEEPEREKVNALDYVQQYLGVVLATTTTTTNNTTTTTASGGGVDWEGLRQENEQLRRRVRALEQQQQHREGKGQA